MVPVSRRGPFFLSTTHENITGQHPLQATMDLLNNQVGRDLFVSVIQNGGYWGLLYGAFVENRIVEMMTDGLLWYLAPLGPGGEVTPDTKLIQSNK